jgi:hypothetical protein
MLMVASNPAVDPDAIQESASRYADMAVTANYAAVALRMMSENPKRKVPPRYLRALEMMAAAVDTLVKLENRHRLGALIDQSLGVVEDLEPAQLVARLATAPEGDQEAKERLYQLLGIRDDLFKLLESPNARNARRLLPIFKQISQQAMTYAQNAEERLGVDEAFIRSHAYHA